EVGVVVARVDLEGLGELGLGGGGPPGAVVGAAERLPDRAVPGAGAARPPQRDHRLVGVAGGQQLAAPLEQLVGVDVDGLPPNPRCQEQSGWRPAARACYKHGHDRQPECGRTMVAAAPFRGLRFDPAVVGDGAQVTAPPYDVISAEARAAYESASPYNVVRLILARAGDGDVPQPERDGASDYRQAAALLARWRGDGVLRRDAVPCLYVYEELYELRGARRVQRGVLASVALDDTGAWVVPHERTMAAPVADRLRLLEATEANLSPIFGVYAGARGARAVLDDVTRREAAPG